MSAFNLEHALATWRRALDLNAAFDADDVDELEAHLRDSLDAARARGLDHEAAWQWAMREVGDYATTEAAYDATFWQKARHRRRIWDAVEQRVALWRIHLTWAVRQVRRRPGEALVKIGGLGVALTFCAFVLAYLEHEQRYDRFHADSEQLARLYVTDAEGQESVLTPAPLQPVLAEYVPAIEASARLALPRPVWVQAETAAWHRIAYHAADSTFLTLFTFPLLLGDPATALSAPDAIVLTESLAQDIFGSAEAAMGQLLTATESRQVFRVTGIAVAPPAASSIQFEALASISTMGEAQHWWNGYSVQTFVRVPHGSRAWPDELRLPQVAMGSSGRVHAQALHDVYFNGSAIAGITSEGQVWRGRLLAAIACLVAIVALFNLVNLTWAHATRQRRGYGLRRALGASRRHLLSEGSAEAMILSLGAFAAGSMVALWSAPSASLLLGVPDLTVWSFRVVVVLFVITFGVVWLGHAYPSWRLARTAPMLMLLPLAHPTQARGGLRRVLLFVQLVVAVGMLGAAYIAMHHVHWLRTADTGFDTEQVATVTLPPIDEASQAQLLSRLRNEPLLQTFTTVGTLPGNQPGWGMGVKLQSEDELPVRILGIDSQFVDVLGLAWATPPTTSATPYTVYVNEAFVREAGWSNPIGQTFDSRFRNIGDVQVIGVLRDAHLTHLKLPIGPMVFTSHPMFDGDDHLLVRMPTDALDTALSRLDQMLADVHPGQPPAVTFADEAFASYYTTEARWSHILQVATALAAALAILGLVGLINITATRRTKEFGIRKVLGASSSQIGMLLSRETMVLVLVANAVALPLLFAGRSVWMQRYPYAAPFSWDLLVLPLMVSIMLVLAAVGYRAVRTARANPVEALRYE
ncbi:MAG: FtsX-like permease family protein [Bacteroidota bacterium]